jgi:hypothetical protein
LGCHRQSISDHDFITGNVSRIEEHCRRHEVAYE